MKQLQCVCRFDCTYHKIYTAFRILNDRFVLPYPVISFILALLQDSISNINTLVLTIPFSVNTKEMKYILLTDNY